jgi:hypothetical protein
VSAEIRIDRRFCGPPDSGNGGYTCGRVAEHVPASAEVTLRRPPPLETSLRVEEEAGGAVRVLDGNALVAHGAAVSADLGVSIPEPVGIGDAGRAAARAPLHEHPEDHPFPACFVCGPQRRRGDGLRILVGPVAGRDVAADAWTPGADLADDGVVRPEFVWAALDCSGGVASWLVEPLDGNPYVLGRLAVRIPGVVRAGEPHAVVGWRIGRDGRKLTAGSAIFTAAGELAGVARATWIQLA